MALQPDGKVILAGGSGGDFAFVRFDENGDLDATFDTDGYKTVDFGASSTSVRSLALQADGTIVALGSYGGDLALARLTDAGALDTSFGSGGTATANLGGTSDATAAYDGPSRPPVFRRDTLSDVNSDGVNDTLATLNPSATARSVWR